MGATMALAVLHASSVHKRTDVRIFIKECAALQHGGYNVSLVVADGGGNETVNGIEILDVGKPSSRWARVFRTSLYIFLTALRSEACIVHLHDPELLPWGLFLKIFDKKVIFDAHEDVTLQLLNKPYLGAFLRKCFSGFYKIIERQICGSLDGVVAATPAIAANFQKIKTPVVTVCNYPVVNEFVNSKSSKKRDNVVCYVGGISKARGIETLLAALALSKSKAELYLAGDCFEPDFKRHLEDSYLWRRVNDFGIVDRVGVSKIYDSARVGMVTLHPIPNYLDSLPVKMFEYMAAGLPVVASNFPLWKEIINETRCGLCVDPENPKEIADAVDYLLSKPVEAQEMGKNGRKAIIDFYNWEIESAKLISMYDSLTASSN